MPSERVSRSIDARESLSLVIGPPGTGKSLICGLLVDRYRESHDVVLLGETPIENSAAFQRHLLHHMGADFETIPDGDLHLALVDRVRDAAGPANGLLIVVDEAQSLSDDVLESIRMATNITRDGEPRVCAVLCGGVKLEESLVTPAMEAFSQRVSSRCYLHAMNGEETRQYIHETIRACGAQPEATISDEAIAAVHHACSGVPRLINQLMTEAVDCAGEAEQELIDERMIECAWAQLQQLPSPVVEEPKISMNTTPIEFGELGELEPASESSEHGDLPVESSSPESGCESASDCCDESVVCDSEVTADPIAEQIENDIQIVSSDIECAVETELNQSECFEVAASALDSDQQAFSEEDQVANEQPVVSVSPGAVFGEFDDEEELAIGNGVSPFYEAGQVEVIDEVSSELPTAEPCQIHAEESANADEPANESNDLESILHQEIIGISSVAADGLTAYDDPADNELADEELVEPTSEHIAQDSDEQSEGESNSIDPEAENADTTESIFWMTETESGEIVQDDSDMLVIEDEVELVKVDPVKTVDSQEQTISVDFQAMLARMRSAN